MVEKGLHPQVVVHSKSLELLGQGKVCEVRIMDLNCNKLVFNQQRPDLLRLPVVLTGSPSRSLWSQPGNGVQTIGRLESAAIDHRHDKTKIGAVVE